MNEMNDIDIFQYDSEVRFELHDDEGFIDRVMDISLEDAIGFFKDNYEGEFTIIWFDEEIHKMKITL